MREGIRDEDMAFYSEIALFAHDFGVNLADCAVILADIVVEDIVQSECGG